MGTDTHGLLVAVSWGSGSFVINAAVIVFIYTLVLPKTKGRDPRYFVRDPRALGGVVDRETSLSRSITGIGFLWLEMQIANAWMNGTGRARAVTRHICSAAASKAGEAR